MSIPCFCTGDKTTVPCHHSGDKTRLFFTHHTSTLYHLMLGSSKACWVDSTPRKMDLSCLRSKHINYPGKHLTVCTGTFSFSRHKAWFFSPHFKIYFFIFLYDTSMQLIKLKHCMSVNILTFLQFSTLWVWDSDVATLFHGRTVHTAHTVYSCFSWHTLHLGIQTYHPHVFPKCCMALQGHIYLRSTLWWFFRRPWKYEKSDWTLFFSFWIDSI